MRKEKDALGELSLPDEAYYGIQSLRSIANFDVVNRTFDDFPAVVRAMAEVKKACALTNRDIGALDAAKAQAIVQACDEIIAGRMRGQFPVNISRGGGTSLNMNANEVIANRATEIMTGRKGYAAVHPNDHVNMCQSSNDVMPTVEHIVLYREIGGLLDAAETLEHAMVQKMVQFKDVVRLGRTCLQDGVPMTLGQVFAGFRGVIGRSRRHLAAFRECFRESVMGATVIGTGIGVLPGYAERINRNLSAVVGFEMSPPGAGAAELIVDEHMFGAMQNADGFMVLSGLLKSLACAVGRIANDLRLLSSGPRAGFGEINLPAVAPGSSIMPGKVNPFMCDLMINIMHQVAANDWATTVSVSHCDLDLGASERVGFNCALESLEMMRRGYVLFAERGIAGITANVETCRHHAEYSTSLATMVSALYGYEIGTRIARIAHQEGITCKEAALREKLVPAEVADDLFDVDKLTRRADTVAMFEKYGALRRIG